MAFDYSTSGLPDNQKFKIATAICNEWLNQNMSMFGPEGIANFMKNQPISAAKRIMENCDDWSEESVILALLGPAKGHIIANEEVETVSRQIFGDRTVELMKYLARAEDAAIDADMPRDETRLFLVEGLSTMNDQLIGRARIDRHHQVRWSILQDLEKNFADVKGQNPAIDTLFAEALVKSRNALQALDDNAKNAPASKKGPKPPSM